MGVPMNGRHLRAVPQGQSFTPDEAQAILERFRERWFAREDLIRSLRDRVEDLEEVAVLLVEGVDLLLDVCEPLARRGVGFDQLDELDAGDGESACRLAC